MRGPTKTGRGRSIALQSILAKKHLKNGGQGRRGKCIVLQSISAIYPPKTAG